MAEYNNITDAGQVPSVSLINDFISDNMSSVQHDAICIDKPNTNGISRVYLVYSENGTRLYYNARVFVYWDNGYITNLVANSNGGNIDTSSSKCYNLDSYFMVYGAKEATSGGGGSMDYTPYTEFWFPLVSIIAIIAILSLVYKIIIKRLMP